MKLARKNLRIILVDDDENDYELLQAALSKAGFAHPIAYLRAGGIVQEYFKYTKATGSLAPHIMLLDINMPLIDGAHALKLLRKTSSFPKLPVIILSGGDDPAARRKVARQGIFRFLKKEIDNTNVISALDDVIAFYNHHKAGSSET
jgi:CheY-like chemotaxis protein